MPITFASITCNSLEVHLDSSSHELAAATFALKNFKDYIRFYHFIFVTDSISVKALQIQEKYYEKLACCTVLLSEFTSR